MTCQNSPGMNEIAAIYFEGDQLYRITTVAGQTLC
jgi:hypothetical protein